MPALEETEQVIDTVKSFTSRQLAVVILLVIGSVLTVAWVENRYAKIKEINQRMELSQQQIDSAHFLALELLDRLPEAQRRQILDKLALALKQKTRPHNE